MAIYSRRPKLKSARARGTKLYINDDAYLEALLKSKKYETASDAISDLVNEAIRIRRAKELGRDETMYAVVKKQEEVVHNGTQHLVEKLEAIGQNIQNELGHHNLTITDLAERIALVERQAARNTSALNRLIEISVVCYGILRHYVLGMFVIRLTRTKFEAYAEGFKKRVDIFRTSIRRGNLLLEGDYEKMAADFARGLEEATSIKMPMSNEDQEKEQKLTSPILNNNVYDVPIDFPKD